MQTRLMSVIEASANIFSGMLLAFSISQLAHYCEPQIQQYIWSGFHWELSIGSNAIMTIILTIVSLTRSYSWRRYFNNKSNYSKNNILLLNKYINMGNVSLNDSNKQMQVVLPTTLLEHQEVLLHSAKTGKYEPNNWLQINGKGCNSRDTNSSMHRHLSAITNGDFIDKDSGLTHWQHLAIRAMMSYTRWKIGIYA